MIKPNFSIQVKFSAPKKSSQILNPKENVNDPNLPILPYSGLGNLLDPFPVGDGKVPYQAVTPRHRGRH